MTSGQGLGSEPGASSQQSMGPWEGHSPLLASVFLSNEVRERKHLHWATANITGERTGSEEAKGSKLVHAENLSRLLPVRWERTLTPSAGFAPGCVLVPSLTTHKGGVHLITESAQRKQRKK